MSTKHTPGPWKLPHADEGITSAHLFVYGLRTQSGASWPIALIDPSKVQSKDERQANARLIAAAPDLLAACQRVAEHFKQSSTPEIQGIACDIFQAIAKATGQT